MLHTQTKKKRSISTSRLIPSGLDIATTVMIPYGTIPARNRIDMIYVGLEEANKTTLKCVLIAYQAYAFIQLFFTIHVSPETSNIAF